MREVVACSSYVLSYILDIVLAIVVFLFIVIFGVSPFHIFKNRTSYYQVWAGRTHELSIEKI